MKISYDAAKRESTLAARGLDFDDAVRIFSGRCLTQVDDRHEYGEARLQTYGLLGDRLVLIVWTLRSDSRHIISMRKCNVREQKKIAHRLG